MFSSVLRTGLRSSLKGMRRLATTQYVTPQAAYEQVEGGRGALLDLRVADHGILLHESVTRMPYTVVLGADEGVDPATVEATQDEMLAALTPAQLGEALYQKRGDLHLERAKELAAIEGVTLKDHAAAQAYVRNILTQMAEPDTYAKAYESFMNSDFRYRVKKIQDMLDGKIQMNKKIDDFLTSERESFARFMSMKPIEHNRFLEQPTDNAVVEEHNFSQQSLISLQPMLSKFKHAEAVAELKKSMKKSHLADNKTFFANFYSKLSEKAHNWRVKKTLATLKGQESLSGAAKNAFNTISDTWGWYANTFAAKPTKEQLGAELKPETLASLSGVRNVNIGDAYTKRMSELAASAAEKLPTARPLFLICEASVKSARVANALAGAGVADVQVVQGGVDRWMLESVPALRSPELQAGLDEAMRAATRGAPQNLAEIND